VHESHHLPIVSSLARLDVKETKVVTRDLRTTSHYLAQTVQTTLTGKFRSASAHRQFELPPSHLTKPNCTPIFAPPPTTTLTMFAARTVARAAPRQALARAPARAGRRNYSSESPKQFAGTEDNEFNRERAHIAQHAAESGEFWRKLSL
jgi:hypothetical protein